MDINNLITIVIEFVQQYKESITGVFIGLAIYFIVDMIKAFRRLGKGISFARNILPVIIPIILALLTRANDIIQFFR